MMKDCVKRYEERKKGFEALHKKQSGAANRISNARLAAFLCGLAALIAALTTGYFIVFGAVALAFAALFVYLVILHDRIINGQRLVFDLIKINGDCLDRLKGGWTAFPDDGGEFAAGEHRYTGDLDIFGKSSLFQWASCAKTFLGRKYLAGLFSGSPAAAAEIAERQEAARDLAGRVAWRQRLMAEGTALAKSGEDPEPLMKWAGEADETYTRAGFIYLVRFLPVLTVFLGILAFAFSMIPWYLPVAALLLQYGLIKIRSRRNAGIFTLAEKHSGGIGAYSRCFKLFENRSFSSEAMNGLKERLTGKDGKSAFRQVQRLAAIMDSISNRHTPFYILFNIIALWDYQNLIALEKWKKTAGSSLGDWLAALGEAEALCSLALIRHDHPEWAWPEIAEGADGIEASGVGHPLIHEDKRVDNDIHIKSPVKILLVTGSNMSGKSTFLRTAGVNLVLAYAGAPVCARGFKAPLAELRTCMRIGDNLEKNISSFYAELVRIKDIVEAVSSGRKVFFLLDEIFKGTNSADRHAGAGVLIKKLASSGALGMVSTHDLELCTLAEGNDRIENCHFREYYNEEGIYFDYRVHPGASTTRNAAYLMKLAGIDVETS